MLKKLLLIGIPILLLVFAGGFIVLKTFVFNQPNQTPKEVVRKYIDNVNDEKIEENKNLVTEKFINNASKNSSSTTETNDSDTKLITTFKEERIDKNEARVAHEIDGGILKINIEFKLLKTGSWLKGYNWLIDDVLTPDFGSEDTDSSNQNSVWNDVGMNQEVQLATLKYKILESEETTTIKSRSEYSEDVIAKEGTKFVIVKYVIENTTNKPYTLSSDFLKIIDSQDKVYNEDTASEWHKAFNYENYLSYEDMNPNIPFTGYTVFVIPSDTDSYGIGACKKDTDQCYLVKLK